MDCNNICLRYIVVKFSDRGLISEGYLNLRLMNCLGWTSYATMVAFSVFIYMTQIFKKDFPENMIHGNLWDLEHKDQFRGLY